MQYSLEHISFQEAINHENINYQEFRKSLSPDYSVVKKDIAKGFIVLFITLIFAFILTQSTINIWVQFFLLSVSAVIIGSTLAYLHLFIHEAAHYNLHPDKTVNDKICDHYLGIIFGISIKKYRKTHWLHHSHLGKPDDTESTYFNELNLPFIFRTITGIQALSVVIKRGLQGGDKKNSMPVQGIRALILHTLFTCVLFFIGSWPLAATWLTGLLIFFPFFASLRQLLEHRDELAAGKKSFYTEEKRKLSRIFEGGALDSFFGAAGFDKHLIHHWDPVLSYTSLKDAELFLLDCPLAGDIIRNSKTTYFRTFFSLFKIS